MSGSDVVFNIAKGRFAYYATLPATADSLIAVLLKSTGLESDAALIDYQTLSALTAGGSTECDFTNYSRQTLTNVSVTVDTANDRVDVDCDDLQWATAGGASNNTIAKLLICYKPDTASTDADIIPLSAHNYDETTSGTTLNVVIPTGGFLRGT